VLKLTTVLNSCLVLSVVRYAIGKLSLPYFTKWVLDTFEVDLSAVKRAKPMPDRDNFPSPIVDAGIVDFCESLVLFMQF
jgi:hypothetical protein